MWLSLAERTGIAQLIKPQVVNANVAGPAVDMSLYPEEAVVVVNVGTITDGTYVVQIHHSDTSDGTFVQLPNAISEGFLDTNDDKAVQFNILGYKRFIKALVVETVPGAAGGIIGVTVQGVKKVA